MMTKVMVSFPEEMLAEIDRVARAENRSRSELLREAFRLYVQIRGSAARPGDNPRVRRATVIQDEIAQATRGQVGDSTEDVRRSRMARR
jgi:metal-responsive CopG/Arc/MetJ family transcriptional regulator